MLRYSVIGDYLREHIRVVMNLGNQAFKKRAKKMILPDGFEPSSSEPKSEMIDPYTTGVPAAVSLSGKLLNMTPYLIGCNPLKTVLYVML